jgi:hypothetical protein
MQELGERVQPVKTIITFLHTETEDIDGHKMKHDVIAAELTRMGYLKRTANHKRFISMRLNERKDQFASMLDAIQNYAPHHRLAPPTNVTAVLEITIDIQRPIKRSYTVINASLPRKLFTETKERRQNRTGTAPCLLARMEFFHDTVARNKLRTLTYVRLRAVEPGLLPWPTGTKMFEVNKNIPHKDHFFFTNWFRGIWTKLYDVNPKGGLKTVTTFAALCREHERLEAVTAVPPQLLMHLSMETFDLDD